MLIKTGLSKSGYSYIILDKCWNVSIFLIKDIKK